MLICENCFYYYIHGPKAYGIANRGLSSGFGFGRGGYGLVFTGRSEYEGWSDTVFHNLCTVNELAASIGYKK